MPETDSLPTSSSTPRYPDAERTDTSDELHGHVVADPYRWLEDVADPRTIEWSAEQDVLFQSSRDQWSGKASL